MERLRFAAEYAKSNRTSCKHCKSLISKDNLRLLKIMPSPFHDGFMTNWYHPDCFFFEARPTSTSEISNFNNLRWENQEIIRNQIGAGGASTSNDMHEDFKVECAKSNNSTCTACEVPILKDDIRISKMDYESEQALLTGGIERWHHLNCFAQIRSEMEFFDSGDVIPGYCVLSKEDKVKVTAALPKIKNSDGPDVKKVKKKESEASEKVEILLQKQNDKLLQFSNELMKIPKRDLKSLLYFNDQHVSHSLANMINHLADLMTFGAIEICEKCKNGKFKFVSGVGYTCRVDLTEWAKCNEILAAPKRRFFLIPDDLKNQYQFLNDYVPRIGNRLFKLSPEQKKKVEDTETKDGPKVIKETLPLKGMQFVFAGKLNKNEEELRKETMLLGGQVGAKVNPLTAAVISTEKALQKGGTIFTDAHELDIQVVSEDFIEEAKDFNNTPITLIMKKNICSWGADPTTRVNNSIAKSTSSLTRSGKSIYDKSSSGVIKRKVNEGGAVDPDSKLENIPINSSRNSNTTEINFIRQRNSPEDQKFKLNSFALPRSLIRLAVVNGNQLSLLQQQSKQKQLSHPLPLHQIQHQQPTQIQPVSSPISIQKLHQQKQHQATFNLQTPVKQSQFSDNSSEKEKSNELNRIQQGQVTPPREIMKNQDCKSSSEVDTTSPLLSDYDSGFAYLQQIISNPAETIVQHQIQGHVAKMLLVLPTNEQRLIEFDLRNDEECTVQDLLDQVRIPFEGDTTISLVTNKKLNINYIVESECGIVGADLPDMPDDELDTNECITSNYVEQQSIVLDDPQDIPKYVDGKLAVCLYCGVASIDFNRCIRCRAKLPNDARQIAAISKRKRGDVRTTDWVVINKPPKESECLTLSPDED